MARRATKKEGAATSATQEIKAFAKTLLADIHDRGAREGVEPELLFETRVKIQNQMLQMQLLRFIDGEIDVELNEENVVTIYRHEMSLIPDNAAKLRAILARGDVGRADNGHEVLRADNWSMTSNGLILSLRFSGRHPADAAGLIGEPAQPTVDLTAETGALASEFLRWMKKIETSREDAEAAALEHSEFTYEERKEMREREQADKEEKEERSRPQRLWNAVKEGRAKAVTEVLEKPFVRTQPPKPLVNLADDSGWTLLHWAAFKGHKEVVQTLLRNHADIAAQDCIGNIPFHLASIQGCEETAVFLMERMASKQYDAAWALNAANHFGSTALVDAACSGHNALAYALFQGKCDWEPADDPRQIQNVKEGKLPSDFKRDWGKAAGGTKYDKRPGSGSNSST